MLRLIASDIDGTLVPDSAPTINEEYFEVNFDADPQHKYRQLDREELLKLLGK